jgi:hypothetical protein
VKKPPKKKSKAKAKPPAELAKAAKSAITKTADELPSADDPKPTERTTSILPAAAPASGRPKPWHLSPFFGGHDEAAGCAPGGF